MTPQVREIEQTPIAAPSTAAVKAALNVLQETKAVVEIKAPTPEQIEESGSHILDKRRRRRARLSNRH
ncbi:MAG: hypothetical protein AAFO74_09185 [Pseudomonadota bacterium]